MSETLHEYELIPYGHNFGDAMMMRKYRIFRFTEKEAYEKNQAYALNNIKKRLVKVEGRDLNNEENTI